MTKVNSLLTGLFLTGAAVQGMDVLEVYPPYPAEIRRNFDYEVSVSQGNTTRKLEVISHCDGASLSGRGRGSDSWRRFCEFAFSGTPVRVDVRVFCDVQSYTVFPSAYGIKSSMNGNCISVYVDRPMNFGIKLNGDVNTVLSIFADAPEDPAKIPQGATEDTLVIRGWYDAPDGILEVNAPYKELYIAPGAVLNGRVRIKSDNCLVHGRGMVLDPFSDIYHFSNLKHHSNGFFIVHGRNARIRDIKLVDARCFNYILSGANCVAENIKAMSSEMCTDGISMWGASDCTVRHAYLYVGDNALVVSGSAGKGIDCEDIVIGTTCAAIFPQSSYKTTARLKDIHVFRSNEGLINNYYNGPQPAKDHQTISLEIENLYAVDCDYLAWIFQGRNMGTRPKSLKIKNMHVPELTGQANIASRGGKGNSIRILNWKDHYLHTENYSLDFTNLYVGGKLITDAAQLQIQDQGKTAFTFKQDAALDTGAVLEARHNCQFIYPHKVMIGSWLKPLAGSAAATTDGAWDQTAGIHRLPFVSPGNENLLAERGGRFTRWSRTPSWQGALFADQKADELTYCLKTSSSASMFTLLMKEIKQCGAGVYRFTCEARKTGEQGLCTVRMSTDAHRISHPLDLSQEWKAVSVDFTLDDAFVAEPMILLGIGTEKSNDGFEVRKICLKKIE